MLKSFLFREGVSHRDLEFDFSLGKQSFIKSFEVKLPSGKIIHTKLTMILSVSNYD